MVASDESLPVGPRTTVRRPAPVDASAWLKQGIFLGGLVPLASIVVRGLTGGLTADPIAEVENELGLTALIFLIASIACTPARRYLGWTWPPRIRRELGLFAFAYATLHFLMYLAVDQGFDLGTIIEDIALRPFITVGFLAFVLMVPLAITSTGDAVRRLGFRRWTRLHQLVYVAGILAAIHFIWRVKLDVGQPVIYATVLAVLLLARVGWWLWQRNQAPAPRSPGTRTGVRQR
jgi:sulfoxide reductase heme-binding subunit YedZ